MRYSKLFTIAIAAAFLLVSCGSKVTKTNIPNQSSVEITLDKGKTVRGLVKDQDPENIVLIVEGKHKAYRIPKDKIVNAKSIDVIYDDYARPISDKEISQAKTYWRTATFAVLGAVVGGALGFVIGEQGSDDPQIMSTGTYVGAGVGLVGGVLMGLPSDQRKAIAKVRANRANDIPPELLKKKQEEEEKLKKIEEEKKRLEQELKKKKKG